MDLIPATRAEGGLVFARSIAVNDVYFVRKYSKDPNPLGSTNTFKLKNIREGWGMSINVINNKINASPLYLCPTFYSTLPFLYFS